MEDILAAWIFALLFLGNMTAGRVVFRMATQKRFMVCIAGCLLLVIASSFIYMLDPALAIGFLAGFWHEVVFRRADDAASSTQTTKGLT